MAPNRNALRGHGTFRKLLLGRPELFELVENTVSLSSAAVEALEDSESFDMLELDNGSDKLEISWENVDADLLERSQAVGESLDPTATSKGDLRSRLAKLKVGLQKESWSRFEGDD